MQKLKLHIAFSGGRTSAFMLWWLFNEWPDRDNWEKIVVFANTGKEVEGTLFFVDECSVEWGIPIWWVEAVPSENGKGWSVNHRVVDYENASRNGEPFEAMIARLGIPSTNSPFCSEQLKKLAAESFLKSIGWDSYFSAIGIRADEKARLPASEAEGLTRKVVHPLAFWRPTFKREVNNWWSQQSFDLDIHPDDGNCDNCWKKDDNRLYRNAIRRPTSFNWWQEMTNKYGHFNPRGVRLKPPFNFYRGNKSPKDILKIANLKSTQLTLLKSEEPSGCQESCEAF